MGVFWYYLRIPWSFLRMCYHKHVTEQKIKGNDPHGSHTKGKENKRATDIKHNH